MFVGECHKYIQDGIEVQLMMISFEMSEHSFADVPLFHSVDGVFNNNSHLTEMLIIILLLLLQISTMVFLEMLVTADFHLISFPVESEATISSNCNVPTNKSARTELDGELARAR